MRAPDPSTVLIEQADIQCNEAMFLREQSQMVRAQSRRVRARWHTLEQYFTHVYTQQREHQVLVHQRITEIQRQQVLDPHARAVDAAPPDAHPAATEGVSAG
jgi:hypothetical protein